MMMNLPNLLTISRIVLIPFMLFFLLTDFSGGLKEISFTIALGIFILATITDALDGFFARKGKAITKLGKILDPLADKLLISSALIALLELGVVTAWPVILIIGREFTVTGLRLVAIMEGRIISASIWGKIKTVMQIVTIIIIMASLSIISVPVSFTTVLLWLTVIFTLCSGIDYYFKCMGGKTS